MSMRATSTQWNEDAQVLQHVTGCDCLRNMIVQCTILFQTNDLLQS